MKIYIAGPEVFKDNSIEIGNKLKKLCKEYNHIGLYPLDNEIKSSFNPAKDIKLANIKMIRNADIVIANLSPFRGPEPDSGTVWEVGFAQGLGKIVLGYSSDLRSLKERTENILKVKNQDKDGFNIEDFDLTHNLMFADVVVGKTFEECLLYLKNI